MGQVFSQELTSVVASLEDLVLLLEHLRVPQPSANAEELLVELLRDTLNQSKIANMQHILKSILVLLLTLKSEMESVSPETTAQKRLPRSKAAPTPDPRVLSGAKRRSAVKSKDASSKENANQRQPQEGGMDSHKKRQRPSVKETAGNRKTEKNKKQGKKKGAAANKRTSAASSSAAGSTNRKRQHAAGSDSSETMTLMKRIKNRRICRTISPRKLFVPASPSTSSAPSNNDVIVLSDDDPLDLLGPSLQTSTRGRKNQNLPRIRNKRNKQLWKDKSLIEKLVKGVNSVGEGNWKTLLKLEHFPPEISNNALKLKWRDLLRANHIKKQGSTWTLVN